MIYRLLFKFFKNSKGFTFIGLAAVMVSLALLSTIFWVSIEQSQTQKKLSITFQKLNNIHQAIQKYKANNGNNPPGALIELITAQTPACTLDTVISSPTYQQFTGWCGPYLFNNVTEDTTGPFVDGWGEVITYNQVEIRSCGKNRICGDSDDIVQTI